MQRRILCEDCYASFTVHKASGLGPNVAGPLYQLHASPKKLLGAFLSARRGVIIFGLFISLTVGDKLKKRARPSLFGQQVQC